MPFICADDAYLNSVRFSLNREKKIHVKQKIIVKKNENKIKIKRKNARKNKIEAILTNSTQRRSKSIFNISRKLTHVFFIRTFS